MNSDNNMQYKNYTMIDDLPDVNDLDEPRNYAPQGVDQQYKKYIRETQQYLPQEAGMNNEHQQMMMRRRGGGGDLERYNQEHSNNRNMAMAAQEPTEMPYTTTASPYGSSQLNCLDVCNHISSCPLCSRFYNNDKTVYNIVIAILAIICILLLKRVLNI